ncbi:DUF5000 domain-containing lipoprotein [Compostibacter hankyongensis]|uniref:DUF5000 domain-containing lipoprotein n=1 Tax=Compostibacter hankyongensis TaxID=1007089 RepID=A0ABP8G6F9_9BACT
MKRLLYIAAGLLLFCCWTGCKKEGRTDYLDKNAAAPAQVQDIKIKSTPGGAQLTYRLPKDPNFSYAKAVYEIRPGVVREAKGSGYTDTLRLVGYGDTLTHEVKIYSVGKNEKESAPVSLQVTPLTPPVQSVFDSLTMNPTFGGVQVSFENSSQADLAIEVILDTTGTGTWSTVSTFYTAAPEGKFSARGFDSTQKTFAVFVRDRWSNKSDTLVKSLSPIFEQPIPKNTWKAVHLPGDTWTPAESYVQEHLWDNNIEFAGIFASTNSSSLPQSFTIDLGQSVVISRVMEHQAPSSHFYAGSAVKKFELYGSNDPNPDGSWESWELLGTFESFKPSGLPTGSTTEEDKNYGWFQGEDFSFDHLLPAYRYIRWRSLETYGSSGQVVIAELDIWGQVKP